jgi:hypothetical protein
MDFWSWILKKKKKFSAVARKKLGSSKNAVGLSAKLIKLRKLKRWNFQENYN